MESDTKKFLLSRVEAVHNWPERPMLKEPKSVKRARALVNRFERQKRKANERFSARVKKLRLLARNCIHFGTEKQARAAVEKLEAFK